MIDNRKVSELTAAELRKVLEEKELEEKKNNSLKGLEKEFVDAINACENEINSQIRIAIDALNVAQQLSEKYGVPFKSEISFLEQTYTPSSFYKKFGALMGNEDVDLYKLASWDHYPNSYEGWEHSQVC